MGETRVNLLRILEDLRDAYPGTIEETIVTEVVANALDSGAREVSIHTDPAAATITWLGAQKPLLSTRGPQLCDAIPFATLLH